MAVDVSIACSQAAVEPLGAAEGFLRTKCGWAEIERRCREMEIVFQPLIFESLVGVSSEGRGY